ncbi:NlpC/P60 family protein [Streptomyces sp. LHD-70]|uniref:C40 family peptidase n=1 Tax=Streptomyces sp. LHD-70 TaxID=3072140 RepID=UPI00280E2307|nr:NlpC/P60 family protein [Streptomyces sp. LHD-70]MDQ8707494.1 NlpC/P60 family protein [Streptomyces sp. LHD-70]
MSGKGAAGVATGCFAALAGVLGILILFVAAVAGGAAEHENDAPASGPGSAPSQVKGINSVMLSAYTRAATQIRTLRPQCTGMRWSLVAGIGAVESNHASGRNIAANGDITPRIIGLRLDGSGAGGNTTAIKDTDDGRLDGDTAYERAVGPMQFLPGTWAGPSGADGNGDGAKNPHNAYDAALGTAAYLCGSGKTNLGDEKQLRQAILRYNGAGWYADKVLARIRAYDQLGTNPAQNTTTSATGRAGKVIQAALDQLGERYVWGGGNTQGPTKGGYDCSGLMVYAYYQGAGITLPRTSQTQRNIGTPVPRSEMQPGDLIVINNDGNWGHVGLYIGGGKMVHAPNPRRSVETVSVAEGSEWARHAWDIRRVL